MYPYPTKHVEAVDNVMLYITGLSLILLIGITILMVYFVFRYHRKRGHKPVDIHGNALLETAWIVIPTIIVMTMFYSGYVGFQGSRTIPEGAFTVNVTARMWAWDFTYPNNIKTDTLFVPVNTPVKLNMVSADVNHSLYIPAFRIKEDVIMGRNTYLGFTAENLGSFDIACAEYCGLQHSQMYTKLVVLPQETFDKWYNKNNIIATDTTKTDSTKIK